MPFESGRQFLDSGLDDLDFHIDSFLSIDPEFTGLEVPPITEGIFEPSRPPDIILTKTPGDNQPVQQGGSWYSIIQSAIQTVPGLINAIKGQPGTTIQVQSPNPMTKGSRALFPQGPLSGREFGSLPFPPRADLPGAMGTIVPGIDDMTIYIIGGVLLVVGFVALKR